METKKLIVFVCTGNSCRSVMAEGLFKAMLKQRNRNDIEVRSSGVGTIDGMTPTEETITVMRTEGVDVTGHLSKTLTKETVKRADLLLVMENLHREDIIRRFPGAAKKTFVLKKFKQAPEKINAHASDVMDPIGRPIKDYEEVFRQIKAELERIIDLI